MSLFAEDFDTTIPPNLPPGFSSSSTGAYVMDGWRTSNDNPFSPPNDGFAPGLPAMGTTNLDTPSIPIYFNGAILDFKNLYNTEEDLPVVRILKKQVDGKILAGGAFSILDSNGTARSI